MGNPRAECHYESLRKARISENKARMASLGLERSADVLLSILSSEKSIRKDASNQRIRRAEVKGLSPIRRSDRLKGKATKPDLPLLHDSLEPAPRRLTVPAWKRMGWDTRAGGARGSFYDPVLGICCHFCRQKKMCAEEDCKRCNNSGDINQPCTGKTECSVCHSSNGIMCRACLKVRYGEDLEEVRSRKDWMCPHCIEAKGIKPYWICNSSLCLKKRKMSPTGIAIYHAREQGFKSVAHLLMDQLKNKGWEIVQYK